MPLSQNFRLGIVAAAGLSLAGATTSLSVHVAPRVLPLVIAGMVATGALLWRDQWGAAIVSATASSLAAGQVLFRAGLPQVHDSVHVWGFWAYARAAQAGHWIPMWLPDLGAGMPLLQFYGPLNFLVLIPGVLAHATPVELWKESMVQSAVLSSLAVLLGARLLGASWRGSMVGAVAFTFSPWRLTLVNFRGAVGEANGMIFAPLLVAAVLVQARRSRRASGWVLAIAFLLLLLTHLITLLCTCLVLVPILLVQEIAERTRPSAARLVRLTGPVALAVGLGAVWLVPAVAEQGYTSLSTQTETHSYFVYRDHGLGPDDLLVRREWDMLRVSLQTGDRSASSERQAMPFYTGAVLFATALASPWWSRSRATWAPAAGAAIGLFLSTRPAAAAMSYLPLIHTIQFPWRFLSVAAVLASFAVALGVSTLMLAQPGWKSMLPVLALPSLLVFDGAPYTGAAGWVPPYHGVTHWVQTPGSDGNEPFDLVMRPVPQDWTKARGLMRVADLFLPPDDTTTPIGLFWVSFPEWMTPPLLQACQKAMAARDWAALGVAGFFFADRNRVALIDAEPYVTLERDGRKVDEGAFTRTPGHIEIRASVPAGGAALIVREQMFPGWEARVDGQSAQISATRVGFMQIDLTDGPHNIVLDYTGNTRARWVGFLISSATAVLMALVTLFRKRGPLAS